MRAGCCAVVVAQWQGTGGSSQVSWVWFLAAASLFTFLYFHLKAQCMLCVNHWSAQCMDYHGLLGTWDCTTTQHLSKYTKSLQWGCYALKYHDWTFSCVVRSRLSCIYSSVDNRGKSHTHVYQHFISQSRWLPVFPNLPCKGTRLTLYKLVTPPMYFNHVTIKLSIPAVNKELVDHGIGWPRNVLLHMANVLIFP